MDEIVLTVNDLLKSYGNFVAVDGIDFEMHRGEILSLLGPNRAGKTTSLECLEGIRRPDQGNLDVLGIDPTRDWKKREDTRNEGAF